MADQKALKKRLKTLMKRPENQICSDCPEKRPTWASLIVPPKGAPPGTEKIGSFMCLECSGSHRRLGVHISFVRSVNLDSWKEWEVQAMENGGNAKVNAIFEAKLAQSGRTQPSTHADGPTRERFIRDKYERRKFYDPAGFSIQSSPSDIPASNGVSDGGNFTNQPRPGAPSDAARRRVANRQARMKPQNSNAPAANAPASKVPATQAVQAPVSAPVQFDLLDFGSETAASTNPTSGIANQRDLFSSQPATTTPGSTTQTNLFPTETNPSSIAQTPKIAPHVSASTSLAAEFSKNPAPTSKPSTSNDDIMALFAPSKQQQNQQQNIFGMQAMNQMNPSSSVNNNPMMMMNGMMSQQQNQSQQGNMVSFNNQQNMMSQQQQQMMMGMQRNNSNMMPSGNQMMQQQMMQQQQMMMQQHMANQFQSNNASAMSNMGMHNSGGNGQNNYFGGNAMNNSNMNSVLQGMQNMNMGNINARQTNDDGGFGAPMGGSSQQQTMKKDVFSSLGGMNAFR